MAWMNARSRFVQCEDIWACFQLTVTGETANIYSHDNKTTVVSCFPCKVKSRLKKSEVTLLNWKVPDTKVLCFVFGLIPLHPVNGCLIWKVNSAHFDYYINCKFELALSGNLIIKPYHPYQEWLCHLHHL